MSVHNKVVWSEGLFLQPQHFQQQDRYFERFIEGRCQALITHSWGFTEIELERDLLRIGKFALRRAAGVFPDGTPFRMPDDDPLPAAVDVGSNVRDQIVYLAVPLRRADSPEIGQTGSADGLVRHTLREWETRDVTVTSGGTARLQVGALRTRVMFGNEVTQAYACIPLAHLIECRADKQVLLEDAFIPTVLYARAATRLSTFMKELLGLLHQRGEALGGRVVSTDRGGASEISNFLFLQAINRYEPLIAHFADSAGPHPEDLFRVCVSATGEFATFTTESKRVPPLAPYRHDRLRESFEPVIRALQESLGKIIEQTAIPIPVEFKRFGFKVAQVADRTLFDSAVFILGARADVPADELRKRVPSQLRIGPPDQISDLVTAQLSGVPVYPVPVAPRQIPYHAGFVYFELDQTNDLWNQLKTSGVVAMHLAGEFPGLAMEFWAIRS